MVRLSQSRNDDQVDLNSDPAAVNLGQPRTRGELSLLAEWLNLNLVFQAVVWPLMLNAQWTVRQTAWINATVASWSLLAGLITACGRGSRSGSVRTVAMVACLLVLVGEPAAMALLNLITGDGQGPVWMMRMSPIQVMWDLTRVGDGPMSEKYYPQVIFMGVASAVGWLVLWWSWLRKR